MVNYTETCSNYVFNIHLNLTLRIWLVQIIECFYQKRKELKTLKIRVIIFVYLFVVFFLHFSCKYKKGESFFVPRALSL